jgi:beta-galactosidase
MLVSPDSRWAFHIQPLTKEFNYNRQLQRYYAGFRRTGIGMDVVFPESDFTGYRIIVAPSLFVVDPTLTVKLTKFVEQGGTLVLTYRSGVKDEHNVFTNLTLPGLLAKLAGVAIHDYDPQTTQKQELIGHDGKAYESDVWYDILTPTTAQTLATYGKLYYAGKPAITLNHFGAGNVFYVGTEPTDPEFYDAVASHISQTAGVECARAVPAGVEMTVREKGKEKIIFLMNFADSAQTVALKERSRNALTGVEMPAEISLKARDALVLIAP